MTNLEDIVFLAIVIDGMGQWDCDVSSIHNRLVCAVYVSVIVVQRVIVAL